MGFMPVPPLPQTEESRKWALGRCLESETYIKKTNNSKSMSQKWKRYFAKIICTCCQNDAGANRRLKVDTINKLLAFFGLVKISRAKRLTTRMHEYYVQSVNDGVQRDFGATSAPDAVTNAGVWWGNEFDRILVHQSDDVEIITAPKFKGESR